jgi:hypothetical protein
VNEPPTEVVDYGPTFHRDEATGHIHIDWHGNRPENVMITADLLEHVVEQRNTMVTALATQDHRLEAMDMLLKIIRLGRRPSREDWDAAQLTPLTKEVRLNLLSRKRRPTA